MSFDELKANAEYELLQEQKYCDESRLLKRRSEVLGWYEHQQERLDYFKGDYEYEN